MVFLVNAPVLAPAEISRTDALIQSQIRLPTSAPHKVIRSTYTATMISIEGIYETVWLDRFAILLHVSSSSDNLRP